MSIKARRTSNIVMIIKKMSYKRYVDFNKYTYEFMWIGIFIVAIVWFIRGRSANDTIANAFNKGIAEAISSNFAHFGTQKDASLALE